VAWRCELAPKLANFVGISLSGDAENAEEQKLKTSEWNTSTKSARVKMHIFHPFDSAFYFRAFSLKG